MDRDELLQILQEETDEFTEQSRLRDDVLDALEKVQEKAINYTHCCESDSEQLVLFADWLQYNGKWDLPKKQAENFLKEQQEQN